MFCFRFFPPNLFPCFPFFYIFTCRNFFIYFSRQISHSDFVFLRRFLKGTTILSPTNFAPAWISSFNSVMLSIGIFVNKLFFFSISTKTFFQSWFLRDGNVVFFSIMIFFINPTSILSSCVNVCSVLLGLYCFSFSLFCVSIRLGAS